MGFYCYLSGSHTLMLLLQLSSPRIIAQSPGPSICPDLVGCNAPIEKLIPSLTTSTWARGFGNIIRAHNIKTVGNLSALSESQIEGLPIRSPKVFVVKSALEKFQSQQEKKEGTRSGAKNAGKFFIVNSVLLVLLLWGIK